MTEYAHILDISGYWKDCPDWGKIQENFNVVILRAGIGNIMDVKLEDYVSECVRRGISYATYHIPSPATILAIPVERQAEIYCSWPGVQNRVTIGDLEPPLKNDPRMVNSGEALRYMTALANISTRRPWWYSNADCVARMFTPSFLQNYKLWAAQYLYDIGTDKNQYSTFAEFFRERTPAYGPPLPTWVRDSIYEKTIVAWQFTSKGDAQNTCAFPGISGADYSISTVDRKYFLELLGEVPAPEQTLDQRVASLEEWVKRHDA